MLNFVTVFTTDERMSEIIDNRRLNMLNQLHSFSPRSSLVFLCVLLAFCGGCNRGISERGAPNSPAPKRYALKGKVISIDKQAAKANINNEPIPGFMDPMVMTYPIKPSATLEQLQPGDSITADVVVDPDKYWLENVKITGHSPPAADKPASATGKNRGRQ